VEAYPSVLRTLANARMVYRQQVSLWFITTDSDANDWNDVGVTTFDGCNDSMMDGQVGDLQSLGFPRGGNLLWLDQVFSISPISLYIPPSLEGWGVILGTFWRGSKLPPKQDCFAGVLRFRSVVFWISGTPGVAYFINWKYIYH
jgi:hypothetical protein